MTQQFVRIRAPSRVHFGMLSFGDPSVRQFGGVGVMIEAPGVDLTISPSSRLTISGPCRQRVCDFVDRWTRYRGEVQRPACRIHVAAAPRQHIGLGAGTQLALSVAAGLDILTELPPASPAELSASVGRGQRSAVGTYGFFYGGLIAEMGKRSHERLAALEKQIALPESWRIVLLIPKDQVGLFGPAEQQAFATMTPVPRRITEALTRELTEHMLPAAENEQFDEFGESVYRFGVQAGTCFAERQAGAFASGRLADYVRVIRRMGVHGVGQSSWGPTLFALMKSEHHAAEFLDEFRSRVDTRDLQLVVTRISNSGARRSTRLRHTSLR